MNKQLNTIELPLTLEMMKECGLRVIRVFTNDPHYERDNRPARNVQVEWEKNPTPHEIDLAEWCLPSIGTFKHILPVEETA
jgi:hypothetical protein